MWLGFHYYRVTTWLDVYDGEMVSVVRETDPNSLQRDRYACSVKRIKEGLGVLMARLELLDTCLWKSAKYVTTLSSMVVRYLEPLRTLNHEDRPYLREA